MCVCVYIYIYTYTERERECYRYGYKYLCVFMCVCVCYVFPDGSNVKNPPAVQETQVWSLGREDSLENGVANHFSILAWRIPWTEEPGELQSMGLQRVGHNWNDSACMHVCVYVCIYIYVCIYMYICICMYIYMCMYTIQIIK